jgi:hypothetical protein
MNEMIPQSLWVGHTGEERDFRQLFERGVRAVVQVAVEEPPLQPPHELIYLRFPLLDGTGTDPDLLELAVHSVAALLRKGIPSLVCCGTGMSRSPAVAAAALAVVRNEPLEECLRGVAACHPTDVSTGFWGEVVRSQTGDASGPPGR